jgi:hypothetical protein
MPTTPDSKLPYPAATDPADVPADLQRLAEDAGDYGGNTAAISALFMCLPFPRTAAYGRRRWGL